MVKNLSANAGDLRDAGLIPGLEDPLKKEMGTHCSILAREITWTEEPDRLQQYDRGWHCHLSIILRAT